MRSKEKSDTFAAVRSLNNAKKVKFNVEDLENFEKRKLKDPNKKKILEELKQKCNSAFEKGFLVCSDEKGFLVRSKSNEIKVHFKTVSEMWGKFWKRVFEKDYRPRMLIGSFIVGVPVGFILHACEVFPWSKFSDFLSFFSMGLLLTIILISVCLPIVFSMGLCVSLKTYCIASNSINKARFGDLYVNHGLGVFEVKSHVSFLCGVKK